MKDITSVLDLKDKEGRRCILENTDIVILSVSDNPFAYGYQRFLMYLEQENFEEAYNIRYHLTHWQPAMGFASPDEFEIYRELVEYFYTDSRFDNDSRFILTKNNLDYLEDALTYMYEMDFSYIGRKGPFGVEIGEILEKAEDFNSLAFQLLHINSAFKYIGVKNSERINKEFFHGVANLTKCFLDELYQYMPESVLRECDGYVQLTAKIS